MQKIRVESVGYQKVLTIDLQEDNIPITAYNTGGEKWDPDIGINALAQEMEKGNIVIPSDPNDPYTVHLANQLANEMRDFTGHKDDHTGDGLMSMWFAYSEVRELMGQRVIVPGREDTVKDSPDVGSSDIRIPLEKEADRALVLEQEAERAFLSQQMFKRMRR